MPNPSLNQLETNIAEDDIIKDIRFLFEAKEKDYYEPISIDNAFSRKYMKVKEINQNNIN